MGSFNKVILLGNLTRDIELRHLPSGKGSVANFGLAVNRSYKTDAGEQREEVTFVDCEAWGRTGEVMSQYLVKGRPVFVEGRLKLDQWEKEGQKFSKLKVVVENFQFVDSRGDAGDGGGSTGAAPARSAPRPTSAPARAPQASSRPAPAAQQYEAIQDDDIPF
jgi:single-strand DNA-binding protein